VAMGFAIEPLHATGAEKRLLDPAGGGVLALETLLIVEESGRLRTGEAERALEREARLEHVGPVAARPPRDEAVALQSQGDGAIGEPVAGDGCHVGRPGPVGPLLTVSWRQATRQG